MNKRIHVFVLFFLTSHFLCYGLFEKSKWQTQIQRTNNYYTNFLYSQAEKEANKAIELAKKAFGENHDNYAFSINMLGVIYCSQQKFDEAEKFFNQVLNIYKNDPENIFRAGNVCYNLAQLHLLRGNNAKAEEEFNSAIIYFNKAKDPSETWLPHLLREMIPLCQSSLFKKTKAEDLYKQLIAFQKNELEVKRKSKDKDEVWGIIRILIEIGNLYSEIELNTADPYYKEAEDLVIKNSSDSYYLLNVLTKRATLYEKLKNTEKQKEFLKRAVQFIENNITEPVKEKDDKNGVVYMEKYKSYYERMCDLKKYYQILGMREMAGKWDSKINQTPNDLLKKILHRQEIDKENESLKMFNLSLIDYIHGIPVFRCSSCNELLPFGKNDAKNKLCNKCHEKESMKKQSIPESGGQNTINDKNIMDMIKHLQSRDYLKIRDCVKSLFRDADYYDNEILLNEVEKVLREYLVNINNDPIAIDAVSWCCKILGISNNAKYRSILNQLNEGNVHKKIKGHIKHSLMMLNV